MDALPISLPSLLISKLKTSLQTRSVHRENQKSKPLYYQPFENKSTTKGIRRNQRNRGNGILRLGVTDNINVLRARLLAELRRRQQQVRKNVQDRLESIG